MIRKPLLAGLVLVLAGIYATDTFARRPSASADAGVHSQTESVQDIQPRNAALAVSGSSSAFCSTRTLRGTYQYREAGTWDGEPYRSSGLETFDGKGQIVGLATDSDTGESYRFTGTYEVDGNCHGRIEYSGGYLYHVYVSPDGETSEFISTDVGEILSGPAHRVSHRFIIR